MKVLITGATGFIGSRVTQSLINQGHEVHYLTRSLGKNEVKGAKGFVWDPYKGEIDIACLEGVEAIIHLAGSSIADSWSKAGKKLILDSRIIPTAFLYQVLKENTHQIKHIIGASAIGIYSNIAEVQDEEHYQKATNFLGNVVEQWERGNLAFRELGLKVSLVRIGLVLDLHECALATMIKPVRLWLGAPIGTGQQYYSWIHIDDLVNLFVYVLERGLEGIYNGVAPEPLTNRAFTNSLGEAMGKPIWLPAIPESVIRVALGEKAILVTEGQKVSSEKIISSGFDFKFKTLKTALKDFFKG
ncbi:TIGR01777 family protein [Myroides odoratimimus]|uniref:TIGR01777 family oxidoreductase n=1 Tax=Myroides odoratimimus TaxID=76832 RepID=UPI00103F9865|nr:TIGR01777 family oxidoreductase [Myroides odoratimimus]MCA4792011.1 TIGR01777 family protein [Myroides odoratimimus]MCA4819326.1 TIGR01777 family protein [Myroides odoratimimus]MCO7723908.1 TIGR01777 family oxidoreductase [Myroides odoratimimus]MDM1058445.1 TIGR01777 family protein [Myroides odoratimimus]MDM1327074.1 TIGR01777 family protein [Myroides odoratimimus]